MNLIDIADLDCFYLSYDEPQKEEHWSKILNMVPWAKRIDGVKGSDNAHKAVAEASDTDRFILIDGDNIPDEDFFNLQITLDHQSQDHVFRWKSRNHINGLIYGNGGMSCWPKQFVLDMKSHENSNPEDESSLVEFCFDKNYKAMYNSYSTTFPNGSPKQAFRAGFREGVKMLLDKGSRPSLATFKQEAHARNLDHLYVWQTVGADVENGDYAILGARYGSYKLLFAPEWDYVQVRDFDYLDRLFLDAVGGSDITEFSKVIGEELRQQADFPIVDMNAESSKFFKQHYQTHQNMNIMIQEMDVIRRLEGW